MRLQLPFIFAAITVLAGCTSTEGIYEAKPWTEHGAERDRVRLVGKWLGQAPVREGGSKMWLKECFRDGTYVITFRNVSSSGEIDEDTEYGDWGLSGDIYFTMTRGWIRRGVKQPIRVRQSYFDDAYIVLKLSVDEFIYRAVTTKEVFTVKKVSADYRLP